MKAIKGLHREYTHINDADLTWSIGPTHRASFAVAWARVRREPLSRLPAHALRDGPTIRDGRHGLGERYGLTECTARRNGSGARFVIS